MFDIYLGLAIAGGLSVGAFCCAASWGRRASPRLCDLLAVALVLALVLFIRDLWSSQVLAKWLPYSNLIVLGNWMAPTVALLGGLAWHRVPGRVYRKSLLVGTLLVIAGYSLVHPLRGEVPRCTNTWRNEVCIQSTNASCSPASAATLLHWYGISTTEQEMAELCLTRPEGTYWQGLYRGLKLKTRGTPWDVEVFQSHDLLKLEEQTKSGPVILTVGIPKYGDVNPTYRNDWGWVPGVSHSVVLFRFLRFKQVRVGDPSVDDGMENWSRDDLNVLWLGSGIRLVPRAGTPEHLATLQRQNSQRQNSSPDSAAVVLPGVLARF